jgi:cytochrome c oxidase assembly factor CtaG
VMVPVLLFLGLPTALVLRYFMRRAKRVRLAQALATPAAE